MKILIVIPFGGLANRVRVILSGISLAQKFNLKLKIYWIKRDELNCGFDDLFKPISGVTVKTINNNFLLRVIIKLLSHLKVSSKILNYWIISDKYVHEELEKGYFDCNSEVINDNFNKQYFKYAFFVTCAKFYTFEQINPSILRLNEGIEAKIKAFLEENLLTNYIAAHIRYTDNTLALNNSPLSVFEQVFDNELNKKEKIVVCTDSEVVRNYLEEKYCERLIFPKTLKVRDNKTGIQDALFELILLSKAYKVYGSYGSTFSLLATEISNNTLIILKK